MKSSPRSVATELRHLLRKGASAKHTSEVQRFFKDEIQSHGWCTAALRKAAVRFRKQVLADRDLGFLIAIADQLFRGHVLEEKVFGVFLLQGLTDGFSDREFELFEKWLDRVSTWADHDGLVSYLIGPMIADDPRRAKAVFAWAKSPDRWHRRAAAVALIRAIREQKCRAETGKITNLLLNDQDDMVQKGLGWLLREAAKHDREEALPLLMKIRHTAPRLVLRTACETLPANLRSRILSSARSGVESTTRPRRVGLPLE